MKIIISESQLSRLSFEEFASVRMKGAEKIANTAKEKGGPSMLTYHHFIVKLPYYKKASEGKFDMEKSVDEFKKMIGQLNENMGQVEFQKVMGKIEVVGELIIKNKSKK